MPLVAPKALHGLYFFCEPLAEGSFGVIYVAIHALTRQKVAIKILDKRKLGPDAYRVRSEIEALKQLNHKYIYKLYHVIETQSYFYLVVEYLLGGELFDYILQKERLSEVEARVIFRQIVSAIGYVHSKGFAHRDLKPENILLDSDQNVRIIDFGLCAKSNDVTMLNTFCGSFAYAAPEVLANKEYSGSAADLWSLGVILYTLLCGYLPFDPTKPEELSHKIKKGAFSVPENLSKSSKHLLNQLMCVDPKRRIKIDELRRHPWIVEGFMGHPVDLNEEKVPMSPLNLHIVAEIAAYTRIPKAEMARMLQRRSYDYIMATYMIMESALDEDEVFIKLQRRTTTICPSLDGQKNRTKLASSYSVKYTKPLSVTNGQSNEQSSNTVDSHKVLNENCNLPSKANSVNFVETRKQISYLSSNNQFTTSDDLEAYSQDIENKPPAQIPTKPSVDKFQHQDQKTTQYGSNISPDQHALSPSRSVDSQLNHLAQEIYGIKLSDKPLQAALVGNYDTNHSETFLSSSCNQKREVEFLNSNPVAMSDDMLHSNSSIDECSNNYCRGPTSSGSGATSGWRNFGQGLRDVLTPKKIIPDGRLVLERLRKTRHLNNVILLRKDISPGQIFDKIAAALRQQSIRFTLKGSGFLCIFANDWGKTVLSFELELVYVSAKQAEASSSIKRRLTLKPRTAQSNQNAQSTDQSNGSLNTQNNSNDSHPVCSSKSSQTSNNSSDVSHLDGRILGVKMKRIRGDSFMYTSLCRTILDLADVR